MQCAVPISAVSWNGSLTSLEDPNPNYLSDKATADQARNTSRNQAVSTYKDVVRIEAHKNQAELQIHTRSSAAASSQATGRGAFV